MALRSFTSIVTSMLENMEDGAEGNLEAFATPAVEAFALLCLENNEQDWLHEAKVLQGAELVKKGAKKGVSLNL
jgi:hypothetical protein